MTTLIDLLKEIDGDRFDGRKVLDKKGGKRPGKKCGGSYIAAEKQCKAHKSADGKLTEEGKASAKELAEKVRSRKGLGKSPKVVDEETYLEMHGAGRPSNPGLHRSSNKISRKTWQKMVDQEAESARKALVRREQLRAEYKSKVEKGELRPSTSVERLKSKASGDPNIESNQAAARVLEKRAARLEAKKQK